MKSSFIWILGSVSVILNILVAFIHINEWFSIRVLEKNKDFPFGAEGPFPYYYKTEELYLLVNLTWGTVLSINLIFLLWALVKGKLLSKTIAISTTWLLLFLNFYHGLS